MISKLQMQLHDYDWFCLINGCPVCVSSAGSFIPDVINRDNYVLNSMYRAFQLPRVCGFQLNTQYLMQHVVTNGFDYLNDVNSTYREILQPKDIQYPAGTPVSVQYYAEYFAKLAERGFWVFDRDIQYVEGDRFHLVAWPEHPNNAATLNWRMYSEYSVSLKSEILDFNNPASLVELNLLDLFVEDQLQIDGQIILEQ